MNILFGSDETTVMNEGLTRVLKEKGYKVKLVGHLVNDAQKWKWVGVAKEVAKGVVAGDAEIGIIACWTGTGVCMAANKIEGARAALCWDAETARGARRWDNANILCLSNRFTTETVAVEIVEAFLHTEFDEGELDQVRHLEGT